MSFLQFGLVIVIFSIIQKVHSSSSSSRSSSSSSSSSSSRIQKVHSSSSSSSSSSRIQKVHSSCDIQLSQNDLDSGTYRITNSGTYCITENISFNPNQGSCLNPNTPGAWFPQNNIAFPGSTTQSGPFTLGFFAAISIETSDVIIDLCGHKIEYDFSFYLQQRWGSIIEIGNQPFLPATGPADFGPKSETINNVIIKNGKLGLTSHHGIHSNQGTNITIQNLQIKDFEVGAIQLNGFNGVLIENIKIGPSFSKVPLTAFYSNARFILLAYRLLLNAFYLNSEPIPSVTFAGGRTLNLQQIQNNLVDSLDLVFGVLTKCIKECDVKNDPLYIAAKRLFINTEKLPDGSAIYGIILNSKSVAVNGFGDSQNIGDSDGYDVTIRNVEIKDLFLSVNEIPALYFDKCFDMNSIDTSIQKGPFGDVFDLRHAINENDFDLIEQHDINTNSLTNIKYKGNPLSDAQIALSLFGETNGYSFGSFISDKLTNWAQGINSFPSQCADFVCNGDSMFHVNKGAVGLRMDGIENAIIENVRIKNIENRSPLVSNACGNYSGPHDGGTPGTKEREGGMSTDTRGISITGGNLTVIGNENKIGKLNSFYGDTIGIHVMDDAILYFDVMSDIKIKSIRSASKLTKHEFEMLIALNKCPYPNNFNLCTINIEDESQVTGDVPIKLDETYCIQGVYNNDDYKNGEYITINGIVLIAAVSVIVFLFYCWRNWNKQTKKYKFKQIANTECSYLLHK